MTYAANIKTARMTVVRDALNSGNLEFVNGASATMGAAPLNSSSGSVSGDTLTLAGFPKQVTMTVESTPVAPVTSVRLRSSAAADVKTGLSVGLSSVAAPAWAGSQAYTVGQTRTNGANQYRCTVAGTSAASGGPTGTGASIVDGTATWAYIAPANASVQLSSLYWNAGDVVTVQANPTLQHAA